MNEVTPLSPPLRILHGPGGSAGQPACISRAQRKLGAEARCLRIGENKFDYPADIVMESQGPASYCDAFVACADQYDVFHFYFRPFFYHNIYCGYPMGMEILSLRAAGKIVFLHFRGSEIRLHSVFQESCPHNYVLENPNNLVSKFPEASQRAYINLMKAVCDKVLVTDPELQTYCPEAVIIPRAIDIEDWPVVGVHRHSEPPLIVHAPSRRTVKGTDLLMASLDRLKSRGVRFRLRLVENLPHEQAMQAYQEADIVVDQLRIGWHGVLSVEAMALGKPVVAYIREDLKNHLLPDPPMMMTSPEELDKDLENIILDQDYRKRLSIRARQYAEDVHDSRKIAADLIGLYRQCAHQPSQVDFAALGEFIKTQPYFRMRIKIIKYGFLKDSIRQTREYYRHFGAGKTAVKILSIPYNFFSDLIRQTKDHYRQFGARRTFLRIMRKISGRG